MYRSRIHELLYNHVEVSEHNLESLRLKVSVVDFVNHSKGDMVFYQVSSFLLNRNCKKMHEFEEMDISSKAVHVERHLRIGRRKTLKTLDFVQEFGLWPVVT
jgi:hypothetical protein